MSICQDHNQYQNLDTKNSQDNVSMNFDRGLSSCIQKGQASWGQKEQYQTDWRTNRENEAEKQTHFNKDEP